MDVDMDTEFNILIMFKFAAWGWDPTLLLEATDGYLEFSTWSKQPGTCQI